MHENETQFEDKQDDRKNLIDNEEEPIFCPTIETRTLPEVG